jgi:hypothetical protein
MLKEIVIDNWLKYKLQGPLYEVIENLQDAKEKYSENYTDLNIRIDIYDDGEYDIELLGTREETPEEESKRIHAEAEALRIQRNHDLRQLEILKKKYES